MDNLHNRYEHPEAQMYEAIQAQVLEECSVLNPEGDKLSRFQLTMIHQLQHQRG